jgi:histidyl-tRNA synthetase
LRQFLIDAIGNDNAFILDPSITRGLDYYTGVVFETFLNELPDIGSICSGGRYDNLAGLYSKDKGAVSGVGSSIGLDRLLAALESLGELPYANNCSLAIACVNIELSGFYQNLAQKLRQAGIPCEVFLEQSEGSDKHPVKQFVLAEKKGMRYIMIPGSNPGAPVTLRDLAARKSSEHPIEEVIELLLKK